MSRLLLAIVFIAAAVSLGWFALAPGGSAPAPAPVAEAPHTKVLVAGQPLQAGTLLKDVDFRERDVPGNAIPDGSFLADEDSRAEIRGAMLRRYLDAGDPLRRPDVLRPRDRGFLAAVLAPGTRAVSIGVDAKTGASGLISPGDLVDVILTQEFASGDTPIGHRVVAETVLSMIRVIAVDQQIAQGAPTGSANINPNGRVASTVALQVTPEEAARLIVAERLGRLTLTVRSIDSERTTAPVIASAGPALLPERQPEPVRSSPSSVFGSDVSAALSKDEPATNAHLRLIQGENVSDVVFR